MYLLKTTVGDNMIAAKCGECERRPVLDVTNVTAMGNGHCSTESSLERWICCLLTVSP